MNALELIDELQSLYARFKLSPLIKASKELAALMAVQFRDSIILRQIFKSVATSYSAEEVNNIMWSLVEDLLEEIYIDEEDPEAYYSELLNTIYNAFVEDILEIEKSSLYKDKFFSFEAINKTLKNKNKIKQYIFNTLNKIKNKKIEFDKIKTRIIGEIFYLEA